MIDSRLTPNNVILDDFGSYVHDVMFGCHGWYDIIRKPNGDPGEELQIEFRPFTKEELNEMKALGVRNSQND